MSHPRRALGAVLLLLGAAACSSGSPPKASLPPVTAPTGAPATSGAPGSAPTSSVPTTAPTTSAAPTTAAPTTAAPTTAAPRTAAPAASGTSPAPGPSTYRNPRFGFTAAVPAGLFPATQPADGDGETFEDSSGATYVVSGQNNTTADTPAHELAALTRPTPDTTVTYKVVDGDVVTVSGIDATAGTPYVYYERVVVTDRFVSRLTWHYLKADAATHDPLVTATVAAFTPSTGPG